jgi:hypothetical protein
MGRIVTLLSHYYRPDDDPEILRAQAADWYAVMKGFPIYAINAACIEYLANEPRRKPAPGAIVELCRKIMPKPRIGEKDDKRIALAGPERARITPEAANEILARAGYPVRRF